MINNQKNQKDYFCVSNRIDWSLFTVKEHYNAGIKLLSIEVKPILKSQISLKGAYGKIYNGQAYIFNMYIYGTDYRQRKLLFNKKEIIRIYTFMKTGWILVPEKIYKTNTSNLLKIKFFLAKHLGKTDKRKQEKRLYQEFRKEVRSCLDEKFI